MDIFPDSLSLWPRLALVLGMVVAAHICVRIIRIVSNQIAGRMMDRSLAKAKTINSLVTSTIVFMLYFAAVGIALTELGVPLTAYFASASVIGLAVAFGSQGVVQDVVTGVTAVLADQFDVGEMVEINGQAGIVEKMGIRFTVLRNAFGARVMIPNRTIGNVIVYPRGYVRILADVSLPDDPALAAQVADKARQVAGVIHDELPGALRAPNTVSTTPFRPGQTRNLIRRYCPPASDSKGPRNSSGARSTPGNSSWIIPATCRALSATCAASAGSSGRLTSASIRT